MTYIHHRMIAQIAQLVQEVERSVQLKDREVRDLSIGHTQSMRTMPPHPMV